MSIESARNQGGLEMFKFVETQHLMWICTYLVVELLLLEPNSPLFRLKSSHTRFSFLEL